MKKLVLFTLLAGLFLVPAVNVSAQNQSKEISHWSLGIKGGGNYYRVNPMVHDFMKDAGYQGGLVLEYTTNPYWGFGLSADYLNYDRDADKYLGNTIDATFFTSINLMNVLAPERQRNFWKKVNLYANFGVGAGAFSTEMKETGEKKEFIISPMGTAALNLEIALGKHVGLFGEGQVRYYTRQDLGGKTSTNKDGSDALALNLGLRFKFNAGKKDHARNLMPASKENAELDLIKSELQQLKNQANKTNADVNQLNTTVNDTNKKQDQINKDLQNDIDNLRRALQDLEKQPSSSAVMRNIEFKFDSTDLTSDSFAALDNIVATLKASSAWNKLTIAGHTDNIGTAEVNQRVALERANTVKEYLVKSGIPASKIETVGYGAEKPIASNNTSSGRQQNRRVEFHLSK